MVKSVFKFHLPLLPKGIYVIDTAIADGIPESAKMLQWLHDAILLESHASSVVSGILGLNYENIELQVKG
jgi:lipopolysaccharide transport system ATP-binding protein